jgi:hypothetical protein
MREYTAGCDKNIHKTTTGFTILVSVNTVYAQMYNMLEGHRRRHVIMI